MEKILKREIYLDKVLGMLAGSAIGDAMGAPTEMWSRTDIQHEYGYVDKLNPPVRIPSGEGIWEYNLPAGGTTDDTRWKVLTVEFLMTQSCGALSADDLAQFILSRHQTDLLAMKNIRAGNYQRFEKGMLRISWLQEWVDVAKPYVNKEMDGYKDALSRFYGGEMTCAGLLYSPVLGATSQGDPGRAYETAYTLSIFDLGYARDLSALSAAMTAVSFVEIPNFGDILNVIRTVDPKGYFRSRLVGRVAYRLLKQANYIVGEARKESLNSNKNIVVPKGWEDMDMTALIRIQKAYALLDDSNEDLPFHPAEIFLVTLTALLYTDFDFERSMKFIVNYGRDNDTAASLAGSILGAFHGAKKLPQEKLDQVIRINRERLGIDLPEMAKKLTAWHYPPD